MPNSRLTDLSALGWDGHFENYWTHRDFISERLDTCPARVIGEEKDRFRLQLAEGLTLWGEVSGRLRHRASRLEEWPTTGDWVAITPRPREGAATIHGVLPRKSCLYRQAAGESQRAQVLAANVDTAFIVSSLNQDLNPRRMERYLALVWESGATPVLLLTKSDLVEEVETKRTELESVALGVEVLAVSALEDQGLEAIVPYLTPGKTAVLLGSSGVGKSTLINRLLGEERLATQRIREHDGRGRHTTTGRHLFALPGGGLIIDTPGMRELALLDHEEGLGHLFQEIGELEAHCRFGNCQHRTEPGCGVQTALATGALSPERWQSYLKLQREIRFQETKGDKAAQSELRRGYRACHRSLRAVLKTRRK